jgi:hypothetical protein
MTNVPWARDPEGPFVFASHYADPSEGDTISQIGMLIIELNNYYEDYLAALDIHNELEERIKPLDAKLFELLHTPIDPSALNLDQFFAKRNAVAKAGADLRRRQRVAYRDSIFTVYHFGHIVDGIVKAARSTKDFIQLVDLSELNSLQPGFENHFKKSTRARNSQGHSAEHIKSRKQVGKNATKNYDHPLIRVSGTGQAIIRAKIEGEGYAQTIDGDVVIKNLDSDQAEHLNEIRLACRRAFRPAEAAVLGRGRSHAFGKTDPDKAKAD